MIKSTKKYFIFILVFGALISCKNKAYDSFVFTKQGLFTNGIEGPAVDSKGKGELVTQQHYSSRGERGCHTSLGISFPYKKMNNQKRS